MDEEIKKIFNYVKKEFDNADNLVYGKTYFFDYHIFPAYKIALKLAEKYETDLKVVSAAILLHDIGNIGLKDDKDHSLEGYKKIDSIFKELDIKNVEFKKKVKECVLNHEHYKGDCKEIMVIVSADAMSHIITPFFFKKVSMGERDFEEYRKWCLKKLEKDFERISLKQEKDYCYPYYSILKKILK